MSNLVDHAKRELSLAGLLSVDSDYGGMLGRAVLELVEVFSKQGHSGYSAGLCANLFKSVASYEPLIPLTGEDGEWNEVDYGCEPKYQNKRCSHVFKDTNGRTYDTMAVIFENQNGVTYTSRDSRRDITFPYFPKPEHVSVVDKDEADEAIPPR